MRRDSGLVVGACSIVAFAALLAFGLVILVVSLVGCSTAPGPCSEEGLPPGEPPPGPVPVPGPGNPQPPPSGAECTPEHCGYARKPNGEICSCSLEDSERGMRCAATQELAEEGPKFDSGCETAADMADPFCQWPEQPTPDEPRDPLPEAKGLCGYYAFCCYRIEMLNKTTGKSVAPAKELMNVPICPSTHGSKNETRDGAYELWAPIALAVMQKILHTTPGWDKGEIVPHMYDNCYDLSYDIDLFTCSHYNAAAPKIRLE